MDIESLFSNISDLSCRICLNNNLITNSLFDEVELIEIIPLNTILEQVSSVVVSEEADTTTRICTDCTNKLITTYEFLIDVKKSEEILKLYKESQHLINIDDINSKSSYSVGDEQHEELEILEEDFVTICENEDIKTTDSSNEIFMSENAIDDTQSAIEDAASESKIITESETLTEFEIPTDILKICKEKKGKSNLIGSRLNRYKYDSWIKCNQCSRSFAKEESLKKHLNTAHTVLQPENIKSVTKSSRATPFKCSKCPRTFTREDTLKRHLLAMHPEIIDVVQVERELQEKKNVYKRGLCPYCGESFSQASLIVHIRRHTGYNPYKCTFCEKGFPRRQDLILHERQHTGERPYVCNICGKSFIRPNKLNRHLRIHTGERPYRCDYCHKGFSQSNDLTIHLRRHTGEKPYKCGICGLGFICGSALKTHQKSKSHFDNSSSNVDPYENCRVNTRNNKLTNIAERQN